VNDRGKFIRDGNCGRSGGDNLGTDLLGIVAAQANPAIADLHQHRTAVLNHLDPRAGDDAQLLQTCAKIRRIKDFGDYAFFTGLPAAQAIGTHLDHPTFHYRAPLS
jgi:hypothetical protein